jgi:hypothetical protein
MSSHMTTLGFPVTSEKDFRHYVFAASEFGQKVESPNGSYTLWEPGNGIELWVQTNLHKRIIGMNLHFSGHARIRLGLTRRIVTIGQSILDGAFYAWADPQRKEPESGYYPFVFDVPDYDLHNDVRVPGLASVQLAAFAQELQGFESAEAYTTATLENDVTLAEESFIPTGLFKPIPQGGMREPPLAQAIFSGHVLVTQILTNPVTDQRFYWARVRTLGGEIDIVADPQVVRGKIIRDGIVKGSFWLSGRLV